MWVGVWDQHERYPVLSLRGMGWGPDAPKYALKIRGWYWFIERNRAAGDIVISYSSSIHLKVCLRVRKRCGAPSAGYWFTFLLVECFGTSISKSSEILISSRKIESYDLFYKFFPISLSIGYVYYIDDPS